MRVNAQPRSISSDKLVQIRKEKPEHGKNPHQQEQCFNTNQVI